MSSVMGGKTSRASENLELGDLAVNRNPIDEPSNEMAASPRETKKSCRERYRNQTATRAKHYQKFEKEYLHLFWFLWIPIVVSTAGFCLQITYTYGLLHSVVYGRFLLDVGLILFFGIFVSYWMGIPESPSLLSFADGSFRDPKYIVKRREHEAREPATPRVPSNRPNICERLCFNIGERIGSTFERVGFQNDEWRIHYEIFKNEYRKFAIFWLIAIIVSIAGFILQSTNHSIFTKVVIRLCLEWGAMLNFGAFIAFWKGIPEGPPFWAEANGRTRAPLYYTIYQRDIKITAPIGPQLGPYRHPDQPGPSRLSQP